MKLLALVGVYLTVFAAVAADLLFAETDVEGWQLLVGAVFLGITPIIGMILQYYRDKAKEAR